MQMVLWGVIATFALIGEKGPSPDDAATASARQQYGDPQVMEFKDGKSAAFSMQFDDSMETQADFAVPEMNKRGLVGTFFVNPASERYGRRRRTWEVVSVGTGVIRGPFGWFWRVPASELPGYVVASIPKRSAMTPSTSSTLPEPSTT